MEKNQPLVGKLVDPETLSTENPPVDEFMKQQSELLDMIAGGLAGLSALSAQKNFNEEKINRIVEAEVKKQFDQKDYIEADELPSALENSDVVFKDTFDDQLSDHSVLTVDSELNEYFDVDDIVDKVIDQIEITRK
jgi:cysteinyl-tRNA synthetase